MSKRPSLTTPFERIRNSVLRQVARPLNAITPQYRFAVLFVLYVLITTVLLINTFNYATTEFYKEGDVANRTIIAPADFVTEDKEETERRRNMAKETVPPVFTHDSSTQKLAAQNFRAAWDDLKKRHDEGQQDPSLAGEGGDQAARVIITRGFNANDLIRLEELLRDESETYIYDDSDAAFFRNQVTLVNYQNPSAKMSVEASSLKSISKARQDLSQGLSLQLSGWSTNQKNDITPYLLSFIEPNIKFNATATQSAREMSASQVPSITVTLKRGQAIVREGDKITSQTVSEFTALRQYEKNKRPIHHLLGLLCMVTALYWIGWKFIQHRSKAVSLILTERQAFALVGSAVIIQTFFMRIGFFIADPISAQGMRQPLNDPTVWSFLIPFASAALLVALLVDTSLALLTAIFISLFTGLLAPNGMLMSFYSIVSSSVAIYGIGRYRERQSVTIAGLLVGVINALMAVALLAYAQQPLTLRTILIALMFGVIGGLLTSIFTAGGLPINESVFGILTDVKLLELSNADLPVLGQLALRAPGTNQHSHAVGQLAEEACRAIGANVLLVRIGSLYHDIGKLGAPEYFIENQQGHNPHNKLKPINSAKIITSHVNYGLKLAKEIGLPKRIADFIPQHHGTRTLHYFLRKAQENATNGEVIDENDFRYPGPKPQFKEAAIMMLADSCEAAARSLAKPDPENIRVIVSKIFDAILSDGQLNECDITLRELNEIRESMIASLVAIYHARIDYPGFNAPTISGDKLPLPKAELDSEERGISYEKPSEVPISKGGEVEDEALAQSATKR